MAKRQMVFSRLLRRLILLRMAAPCGLDEVTYGMVHHVKYYYATQFWLQGVDFGG
jgi:hypothetical protein